MYSSRSWMGLVMTLVEDKICFCVWLLYYVSNLGDSRMEFLRYRSISTSWDHFLLDVFSSSEVLGKSASIRIKLPTAACWSREEKRGRCEANLLYAESDFGTTDKSLTVFFARWGVKFDHRVKFSAQTHWVTCDVEAKEKLAIILFCGFWLPCLMRKIIILF